MSGQPAVHVSDDAVYVEWPRGPMHRLTPDGQVTEQHTLTALDHGDRQPAPVELQYPADPEDDDQ
ncbi:hypothetical protein [Actinomycetospora termitidis]|uniref:ATP-grasp-modified RiPP n=1 Tax=Actinomycetospora termitidis TaxID=3053470 RepID=A0ABT7MH17_9PSEU|nr:hypothetical protein [Actinomycetospora sp. Odt1-22]MDL5159464.1 hypothetical protein [Actinomycetospora sp. Odt1-22]